MTVDSLREQRSLFTHRTGRAVAEHVSFAHYSFDVHMPCLTLYLEGSVLGVREKCSPMTDSVLGLSAERARREFLL